MCQREREREGGGKTERECVAKCTVMVIQHHCGQTFSTHLGGGHGRSLIRRGCKAQARDFF